MGRLEVLKTYKIYIGGKFPRTESGRYYIPMNGNQQIGNICLSSRKDVRNAVVAARKASGDWSERTAFNRSQILYRIAEMLEGRKEQFIEELIFQGVKKANAQKELEASIDRLIYYAGWCDKYTQIISSVNPVASSHFNFSVPEAMGVVGIEVDENYGLLNLISLIAPTIAGGNTCVVIAQNTMPLCAITLAEVIATSDVPEGVVNILTGDHAEMRKPLVEHMDVNAYVYSGEDVSVIEALEKASTLNMKRIRIINLDWQSDKGQDLRFIADLQEIKTTWHPIENIGGATSSY